MENFSSKMIRKKVNYPTEVLISVKTHHGHIFPFLSSSSWTVNLTLLNLGSRERGHLIKFNNKQSHGRVRGVVQLQDQLIGCWDISSAKMWTTNWSNLSVYTNFDNVILNLPVITQTINWLKNTRRAKPDQFVERIVMKLSHWNREWQ
jgi:hypothetical protein